MATTRVAILRAGDGRPEHRPPRRRHRRRRPRRRAPGDLLTPSRIGALAAIGCADVEVFARPRVAILSTGNEVVEPGAPLAPGQILRRQPLHARRHRRRARRRRRAAPRRSRTRVDALSPRSTPAPRADIIVFSGGSSVGERDLLVDAIAARGEMIFHGIAVKPGKPTAFATRRAARRSSACRATRPRACRTRTSCSCRSCARPRGCRRWQPHVVRVAARPPHRLAGRPASVLHGETGDGVALPAFKGSGDITSLSQADGYIEIPAERERRRSRDAGDRSRSSER